MKASTEAEKLKFIEDTSTGIEIVSIEHARFAYPPHTHTGHYVFGIVTEGSIDIRIGDERFSCQAGEYFSVFPDVRHSIRPASGFYSMITACIPGRDDVSKELDVIKKEIIGNPSMEISVATMSEKVHVSSYHMIRKFAAENGLTPHQFQMQCRVRKAQELLKQGYKVVDVAHMVGFCDQSHLDRVFKKQVGVSPNQFANSAILSNAQ
ncbi:MAG: AraC family transcriptional regulator [Schwartzia sp.]|nr:AraC family transcriptional regulator [Schwartzia sp. (in: firmicutes)]